MSIGTAMETIIRALLFRHDCVIIPGFGGFILNYVPAAIDKTTCLFHPPARRLSFNRNLNHNDGLLAGTLSRETGVSYTEAREQVDQYVAGIRDRLTKGEPVEIEQIGVFRANQEGGIQFEPDATTNYYLGSYGMEPFVCEPAAGFDVRRRVMNTGHRVPSAGIPLRKILVRAAVAVPVLIALIAIPLKTDILGTRFQKSTLNPLTKAEFEHNMAALDEGLQPESMSATAQAVTEPAGDPSADMALPGSKPSAVSADRTDAVVATPPQAEQAEAGYYLIAGSFRNETNARTMAARLASMGYEPRLLEAPNGFIRVAAGGFPDIESAVVEKQKLAPAVEGLWILSNSR